MVLYNLITGVGLDSSFECRKGTVLLNNGRTYYLNDESRSTFINTRINSMSFGYFVNDGIMLPLYTDESVWSVRISEFFMDKYKSLESYIKKVEKGKDDECTLRNFMATLFPFSYQGKLLDWDMRDIAKRIKRIRFYNTEDKRMYKDEIDKMSNFMTDECNSPLNFNWWRDSRFNIFLYYVPLFIMEDLA